MFITIALDANAQNQQEEMKFQDVEGIDIVEEEAFEGTEQVINLLINLSLISLGVVAKIITDNIKSKKFVKMKYKGMKVEGISEESVLKILTEIKERKKND